MPTCPCHGPRFLLACGSPNIGATSEVLENMKASRVGISHRTTTKSLEKIAVMIDVRIVEVREKWISGAAEGEAPPSASRVVRINQPAPRGAGFSISGARSDNFGPVTQKWHAEGTTAAEKVGRDASQRSDQDFRGWRRWDSNPRLPACKAGSGGPATSARSLNILVRDLIRCPSRPLRDRHSPLWWARSGHAEQRTRRVRLRGRGVRNGDLTDLSGRVRPG